MRILAFLALLCFHFNLFSSSIYVKSGASGLNNGSSWTDAYTNLQTALSASISGDTIFVAKGIYKAHATDQTQKFVVKEGVKVFGGFNGNEFPITSSIITSRDFIINETILSGDLLGNDNNTILPTEATRIDNSFYVLYLFNASMTIATEIDGFTITGGNSTNFPDDGAGIYIRSGNPTLRNIVVNNNSATGNGAGIYIRDCSPILENITVENNYSDDTGGGIYTRTGSPSFTNLLVKDNKVAGDLAFIYGGGMYNYTSTPNISNAKFIGNIVESATGSVYGGGIYNYSSSPIIKGIVIIGNQLIGPSTKQGAGMYSRGSVYQMTNATITKNTGGTLGTGLYHAFTTNPTLKNVLVWEDGFYNSSSTPIISYSLIQGSGGSSNWTSTFGTNNGNNIDANPYLISDINTGNVPLVTGSPALNSGNVIDGNNIGYYQGAGELSSSLITITNGTLSDFGNVNINNSSSEQSFTISGTDLFDSIFIYAPNGFQITTTSNDYTGNTSLIKLNQINGIVNSTTIYVRFSPQSSVIYNDLITISSPTVSDQAILVSGTGTIPPPMISISSNSNYYGNINAGQASNEFSYQISGNDLLGDIYVVSSPNFQISKISGDYTVNTDTLTFTNIAGTLSAQYIYSRFLPDSNIYYSQSFKHYTLSADTLYFTAEGNGFYNPSINVDTTDFYFGYVLVGTNSNETSFSFNANQISDSIIVSVPQGFQISKISGDYSGITDTLVYYSGVGGAIQSSTVYLRFSPQIQTGYSGSLNLNASGYTSSIGLYGTGALPSVSTSNNINTFGVVNIGESSTEQFLNISTNELVDGLYVVAPNGFQITKISGDYTGDTDTLYFGNTGNNSYTIYVRFSPLLDQVYSDSIIIYSLNCDTVYVNLSGTGKLSPDITYSHSFLNFGSVYINDFSNEMSFTIEGQNLTGDINLIAPSGFEITQISGDYNGNTSLVSLPQSLGVVSLTTIFVRFNPQSIMTYNDFITISTDGITDEYIAVFGNGISMPRFFVKADAVGNDDGSDWNNAFISLQSAIATANYGDTIFVAKGVYVPSTTNNTSSFNLKPGVKIYGGFEGHEYPINQTIIDNRSFISNETILSGDLYGNDSEFDNNDENSYHVVKADASTFGNILSNTLLDGFTIKGGNANGTNPNDKGAGLYIKAGTGNTSSPTLKNLKFEYNSAASGSAIYNSAAASSAIASFSILNSEFNNNRAVGTSVNSGAAIYNFAALGQANPTITNVVFRNNIAYNASGLSSYGGAVYNWASNDGKCNPIFNTVLFFNNLVEFTGNSVYNRSSTNTNTQCKPKFINTTFTQNSSTFGQEATVYNYSDGGTCIPDLINIILWNENAIEVENSGGASATYSHCLIRNSGGSSAWDNSLGTNLGNNLDSNPMFLDMINGDVTLISGSPALGTGNSTYANNIGYYQGGGYVPPTINIVSALNTFGIVDVGNSSAEQSYTIEGSNLQDDITIVAPEGFEISLISGDYTGNTDTLYLTPILGTVSPTTIFVRFSPTQAIQYSTNIVHFSINSTSQSISVTGTGNTSLGIIIGGIINNFGTINVGSASAEQSYYVKGIGLTNDISINAPIGFQITTNSGNYSGNTSNIVLINNSGIVDSTVIYVRFSPLLGINYNNFITHTSIGVANASLHVEGQGFIPPWIFVKEDATGINDGTSWANAYNSLQTALSFASNGDSIFVAKGIYIPHSSDRTVSFALKNGVKIFGGFAGNEVINSTTITNRDFVINESILSGDLLSNDNEFTNNVENSYHIVTADAYSFTSISSQTLLDGFTISGGNANDPATSTINNKGAGIYCRAGFNKQSSPSLKNITFKFNVAKYGGAAYFDAYTTNGISSPLLNNIVFENNTATYAGGAVYNSGAIGTCSPVFDNAIFQYNIAQGYDGGGAIYNMGFNGQCNPYIKGVKFFMNTANYNGSAISSKAGQTSGNYGGSINITLLNSTFIKNNNNVVSNRAEGTGSTNINATNVILWDSTPNEVYNSGNANAFFDYCLINNSNGSGTGWNNSFGTDSGNNLDSEPFFIDEQNGDVTLKSISPALNTGNQTDGNNIGFYQGAGIVVFAISNISDYNVCEGESLSDVNFTFADNNPDLVTFSVFSSDTSFVKNQNIIISGTGTNRLLSILQTETSFGSSVISIVGLNNIGEIDSVSYLFSINQKPEVTNVITVTVNPSTSLYTIQVQPSNNILYDYFLDNIMQGSYYMSGVTSGLHTISMSQNGCFSDDYEIYLPVYINDIPLEIVSNTQNYNYICQGQLISNIDFLVKDDSLQHVSININLYNMPDSAVNLIQLNDSMYTVEINSNLITEYYPAVIITATNIYGESDNINVNYELSPAPVITSTHSYYNNFSSNYCIDVFIQTNTPGYIEISIDNEQTWNTYSYNYNGQNEYIFNICGINPGTYTIIARQQSCKSNSCTITLYEYVNNVPIEIVSVSDVFQTICDTDQPSNFTFIVRDDSLHHITIDAMSYSQFIIPDSIITITQLNDSTYSLWFIDSIIPTNDDYVSIAINVSNNYGESASEYLNYYFGTKPVVDTIISTLVVGSNNYCFNILISNISNTNNLDVNFNDGSNYYYTSYQSSICEYDAANYTFYVDNNGCASSPYLVNLLSIENLVDSKITISPNPTENFIFINTKDHRGIKSIKIYSDLGSLLKVYKNVNKLDLSKYPAGVYTITIEYKDNIYSTKILKK